MLKAFVMLCYNITQLGWTFKVTQHRLSPPHTPPNYHFKLMKWQVNKENIIKLQT
jgi:hypothetical protein